MNFDQETLEKLEDMTERHGLRLDVREAPEGGRANIVLFQGDQYLGRLKNEEPILMPQNMDEELFRELVGLTFVKPRVG
ncbi:MAG: hypothetical protein ACE5JJ_12165 [Nitrospinota bacterium]